MERPSGAAGRICSLGVSGMHDGGGHFALEGRSRVMRFHVVRHRGLPRRELRLSAGQIALGFLGFGMDFIEAGDVVVPLEQRGGGSATLDGARVELPDGIDDRMVVGVEDVLLVFGMAGDVDLGDAMGGDGVDVVEGIELVVHRGDVDVVYVEKDAAVGAFDNFGQELPLGHLRSR